MTTQHKVIAIICAIFLSACSQKNPSEQTIHFIVKENLTPAYQTWASQSAELAIQATNYCKNNATSLESVQEQWRKTRSAWSNVLALPTLDLNEQSTVWQIQFWPDKKNLVDFHFTLLKNNPDTTTITTSKLEKSSTVLRGLGASEYLLFDNAFTPDNEATRITRCTLLVANTDLQKNLSAKLLQSWQAGSENFLQIPNASFALTTDALAELLRSEISSIEVLKQRLSAPLPLNNETTTKPFAAEFWRSDESMNSLKDGLAFHEKLFKKSGWELLIIEKNPQLAKAINQHYADIKASIQSLNKPMSQLLTSTDDIKKLTTLKSQLGELQKAYSEDLAKTLGVQIGFNANDGD